MKPCLILMLKYPLPGAVKTRLVPVLGERRACEVYCALVRYTLGEARKLAQAPFLEWPRRSAGFQPAVSPIYNRQSVETSRRDGACHRRAECNSAIQQRYSRLKIRAQRAKARLALAWLTGNIPSRWSFTPLT
jgi:glycosyltransferase A (GT-A) superfamily protein (DUF2064 family)